MIKFIDLVNLIKQKEEILGFAILETKSWVVITQL